MTVGIDLDRLVAETVFGVRPRDVRVEAGTETVKVWTDNPAIGDGWWSATELQRHGAPPKYSSSWDGAGKVIDRMRTLGWRLILHDCPDGWSAIWVHETVVTACRNSVSEQATAPEAISRAALLTFG